MPWYYRDGEKKVNGDTKPFTKAEASFADARFFNKNAPLKEAMPATIYQHALEFLPLDIASDKQRTIVGFRPKQ